MSYLDRPLRTYECPHCGVSHQNRTYNHACTRCQHERRKHPCPDCGKPCDGRAERCNVCAPTHNQTLRVRGEPTFHKPSGYWLVKVPADDPMASMRNAQGYVRQHRLVMADYVGRPLVEDETVHHIDHDRANNVLGNLSLMGRLDHMAMHAAERAARPCCKWGHPWTPESTYIVPKTGKKQCKVCASLRHAGQHPAQLGLTP